jgi:hypothetical protein
MNDQPLYLEPNTLRLGSETQIEPLPDGHPFHPNSSCQVEAGAVHVASLAFVYDTNSSTVSPTTLDSYNALVPAFSPTHQYHFVMDLGSYVGTLTLGNGDGNAFGNSSDTYNISLWEVEAVPEPASVVSFAIGILAVGGARNRRRLDSP